MTPFGRLVALCAIVIVVLLGWSAYELHDLSKAAPQPGQVASSTADTYGMTQYTDSTYGFSFWYPSGLSVVATSTNDTLSFPGGTMREELMLGTAGGTSVVVVDSASSTITDEPIPHASPIAATKYFWNAASSIWMVAYPEGSMKTGTSSATTTANASNKTIGGLAMLPSGRRFDTTIIPLSPTRFIVVTDGGGSTITAKLAATVASTIATVNPQKLGAALSAESAAYQEMQ